MARAVAVPGQELQTLGMGRVLHTAFGTAREIWQGGDGASDWDLSRFASEGSGDEFTVIAFAVNSCILPA